MNRKDMLRYFNVGETLECTAHWRSDKMVGQRRVVHKIGKERVEFTADVTHPWYGDYRTPSDLYFPDVTSIERYDGNLDVVWADGVYISYRVVEPA